MVFLKMRLKNVLKTGTKTPENSSIVECALRFNATSTVAGLASAGPACLWMRLYQILPVILIPQHVSPPAD